MEMQWSNHSQNSTEEQQKKVRVIAGIDNVANETEGQT